MLFKSKWFRWRNLEDCLPFIFNFKNKVIHYWILHFYYFTEWLCCDRTVSDVVFLFHLWFYYRFFGWSNAKPCARISQLTCHIYIPLKYNKSIDRFSTFDKSGIKIDLFDQCYSTSTPAKHAWLVRCMRARVFKATRFSSKMWCKLNYIAVINFRYESKAINHNRSVYKEKTVEN